MSLDKIQKNKDYMHMTSELSAEVNGFYNGFALSFDEDFDERIFEFIDRYVADDLRTKIFSIGESKAVVRILWLDKPGGVLEREGYEVDGDFWTVWHNKKEWPRERLMMTRVIPKELRYHILKEQKWSCNNCGTQLRYSKNSNWKGEIANIDHIHPFSKRHTYSKGEGKINHRENLQALCETCNKKKKDKFN